MDRGKITIESGDYKTEFHFKEHYFRMEKQLGINNVLTDDPSCIFVSNFTKLIYGLLKAIQKEYME